MSKETTPDVASTASKLLKMIPKLHKLIDDIEAVAASALTQAQPRKRKKT